MITILKTNTVRSIKVDLVLQTKLNKASEDVTYTPYIYTNNTPYDRGNTYQDYWKAHNEGLAMFNDWFETISERSYEV